MAEAKDVVFNDENYFGHCPVPRHENYYLNVSRGHWMVCDECEIKWFIGANVFSSWRQQNETIWRENAEKVKEYKEIDI